MLPWVGPACWRDGMLDLGRHQPHCPQKHHHNPGNHGVPRRHDPCIRGVGDRTKRRSAQRQHLESAGKHRQSCQCKQSMPARARHTRCGIGRLRDVRLPAAPARAVLRRVPHVAYGPAPRRRESDAPQRAHRGRVALAPRKYALPAPGCTGAIRTSGRCAHSSGDGCSPFMELLTVRRLNAWQGLRNLRRVEPCAHRLIMAEAKLPT